MADGNAGEPDLYRTGCRDSRAGGVDGPLAKMTSARPRVMQRRVPSLPTMPWQDGCEPCPGSGFDACRAAHKKAVTGCWGLGMVTASCFRSTSVPQRGRGRWCSEPVNDPLTTRGHFAAVIDGRCPSWWWMLSRSSSL